MSTAATRLQRDYARLLKDPIPLVKAAPFQQNILEWRYIITGPPGTPYEGGLYFGALTFPSSFPFRPPSIEMLTPSGRFETHTRLCLSVSDFHPELWNPMWSVGTILQGVLAFMATSENTHGSIAASDEDKRKLAKKSRAHNIKDRTFCELFPEEAASIEAELKLEKEKQKMKKEREEKNTAEQKNRGNRRQRVEEERVAAVEIGPEFVEPLPDPVGPVGEERRKRRWKTRCSIM